MDPELERFWGEFQSEADEHIAGAGRLLDLAVERALAKPEIAELFRAFHSLKGLASVMGLDGMAAVAHRSESLLGLVRDRGIALDPELAQGLAAAVDQLARMLAEMSGSHRDIAAKP